MPAFADAALACAPAAAGDGPSVALRLLAAPAALLGAARPTIRSWRAASSASIFPIPSALPPASTRMPRPSRRRWRWASASSRSAASRRARSPAIPRPRLFRLSEDRAVINRMGFNNDGLDCGRGPARRGAQGRRPILGVNLGKNKDSADAAADYAAGVRGAGAPCRLPGDQRLLAQHAGPARASGPRAAGGAARRGARRARGGRSPAAAAEDRAGPDREPTSRTSPRWRSRAGSTGSSSATPPSRGRDTLRSAAQRARPAGLSGRPLFAPSTALLADMYRLTEGKLPLIGVGGIASAEDAYAKIRAGASLLQLYTALVYEGAGLVGRIKTGLAAKLRADGFRQPRPGRGRGSPERGHERSAAHRALRRSPGAMTAISSISGACCMTGAHPHAGRGRCAASPARRGQAYRHPLQRPAPRRRRHQAHRRDRNLPQSL